MYQLQNHGVDYPFRWLEQRLLPRGSRLVIITRSPGSFAAAWVERLKVSGNPRRLVSKSALRCWNTDSSDKDTHVGERIVDWMEQTGGL